MVCLAAGPMRALLVFGTMMLVAARPAGASTPDDDDPKVGRADSRTVAAPLPDEDDPKLARAAMPASRTRKNTHAVPRVKLAYRRLSTKGLEGDSIDFSVVEPDYYPSSGYFRFGLDTEVGIGN